jgi:TATA-box binding protein (TBP) (component of TFIID and TFIIIB)
MNENKDIFEKLKKKIEYDLKPEEAKISTMTICLVMGSKCIFECYNIGKYLKLDRKFIDEIKFCDENNTQIRSFNKKKIKVKKKAEKKKKKESFYNQVTIIVRISDIKTINIKLFKNGSIQMTGCDSIVNTKYSIEKLFEILNKPRYLLNLYDKNISTIKFLKTENDKIITIDDIIQCNVHLINCNFNIGFRINRDKLFDIISNKHSESILEIKKNNNNNANMDINLPQKYIDSTYDPIRHACVNIKLNHPIKTITIFVFESGSIIILGKSCDQIRDAYNFINVFLLSNYFNIYLKSD